MIFEVLLSEYGAVTIAAANTFLSYEKKLFVAATEVLKFDQQLSPSFCNFATLGSILRTWLKNVNIYCLILVQSYNEALLDCVITMNLM